MFDEGAHAPFEPTDPVPLRLPERPAVAPAVVLDTIAGDHRAGAVLAATAMHKHPAGAGVGGQQHRQSALHFAEGGRGERRHAYVDVFHSELLRFHTFPRLGFPRLAQVQIDRNMDRPKLSEPSFSRRSPAKDVRVDLSEVAHMNRARLGRKIRGGA